MDALVLPVTACEEGLAQAVGEETKSTSAYRQVTLPESGQADEIPENAAYVTINEKGVILVSRGDSMSAPVRREG